MGNPIRRRWFQFSILSLLILMTFAAIVLQTVVVPARRQRDAVAKILELGGAVSFDYQQSGAKEPSGPKWLRKLLGNEYFQKVRLVALHGSKFDKPENFETAMDIVERVSTVDSLALSCRTALDDSHVAKIAKLPNLKNLYLYGDSLDDDALALLVSLPNVKGLFLNGPTAQCTDASLASFAALKGLKSLAIRGVFTDAGLASLAQLENLEKLELEGNITDAGMIHLNQLAELEHLECNYDSLLVKTLYENTDFECENVSPQDFVNFQAAKHGFKFRFEDDPEVQATSSKVINEKVAGITLRQLLDRNLAPLGLGFRIDSDTLVITTKDEADRAHAGINQLKQKLPNLKDVKVGW